MKRVLITGANSYIGDSVRDYLTQYPESYFVIVKDAIGWEPTVEDFEDYDVVFNVAGIAHRKETNRNQQLYYDVNRDLVVKIAKTAKKAGVKQFILLSSMTVYGVITGRITKTTPMKPANAYGRSKAEADMEIEKLADEGFKFACLRPPMVYGKGCKGNYQSLRKFVLKSPVFPKYDNQRSMIFIGNLCEFVKKCIDENKSGLFFPQNSEYTNTSRMVEQIAKVHRKKIFMTKVFNWIIKISPVNTVKKVFGNLTYDRVDLVSKYDFEETIRLTEE